MALIKSPEYGKDQNRGRFKMKNLLCLLILLSCIILCTSCTSSVTSKSEDFTTIHNGTKFGMNMDEVKACETKAGFNFTDVTDNSNYTTCLHNHDVWSIRGEVAGETDATIAYHFENSKLKACIYKFYRTKKANEFANNIINRLKQKYGDADDTITSMSLNVLTAEALASHLRIASGRMKSKLVDIGSWRIPVDNNHSVIITYVNYTFDDWDGTLLQRQTDVGYEIFSNEEIEAAIAQDQSNESKKMDDL